MDKNWYATPLDEVSQKFQSDFEHGLQTEQLQRLKEEYGANKLSQSKQKSHFELFLQQFNQPLVIILLFAALGTGVLQEWVDCIVILSVVLVNSVIGYLQEAKALKAIASLSNSLRNETTVIRNGKRSKIDATDLVPGDIVLISSGDKTPADLRLISTKNLKIDEAALTGESVPSDKNAAAELKNETPLGDRVTMAYASTFATYGQGKGIVVATANDTEIGKINKMIDQADVLETPLTRKIEKLSKILLWAIMGLAVLTGLAGWFHGQSINDIFLQAVALAVGAVPEGLPAVITITLAIGVSKLAKKNSIIRKLPAVETLGSTTVICSDKTGTLTQNQMTVKRIWTKSGEYSVTGNGYDPTGVFQNENGKEIDILNSETNRMMLLTGLLCNDANLNQKENSWHVDGDPTEGALLASGLKAIPEFEEKDYPRMDSIPFESEYKYMATLNTIDKEQYILMKGSVESVLSKCESIFTSSYQTETIHKDEIHALVEKFAKEGQRVLAFALKKADNNTKDIEHSDLNENMIFLGLQALIDPPREEAIEAVHQCIKAGVKVKMITGDHVITARAIAKELGFKELQTEDYSGAINGTELSKIKDPDLPETADELAVFARVTPEQKYKLVRSLQSKGHIVAMTGDGVNDAPALKQADIGIAMGITGTEVSKDASDMVLANDNFSSIVEAVKEGRGIFDNLVKFITWTLPTNLSEGLVILIAVFLGLSIPVSPLQILWINMSTAVLLGMMLAFEEKDNDIMTRTPRNPEAPILDKKTVIRIFWVGLCLVAGVYYVYDLTLKQGSSVASAQTAASNMLVFGELFYLFNCRSMTKSMFKIGLFSNKWVWIGSAGMALLQIIFTYVPFFNTIFGTEAIGWIVWGEILLISLGIYLMVEAEKKWLFHDL